VADEPGPLQAPRGTHDVLWPESWRWVQAIGWFADLAGRSGFGLIVNPMFEEARVFRRAVGDESEVVGKEMYEFDDRGGRRLALRPEGTASVVRAFVQHRPPVPFKAWYLTPAFRYERAASGRYRQHHQLGIEALGTDDPDLDVEVIVLAASFYDALGLTQVELKVNTMGCAACRPGYVAALRAHLDQVAGQLCDEHRERYVLNPLRVLDCKTDACRAATATAPKLLDAVDDACASHFARVRAGLDQAGRAYRVDPRLVRGFDYYTRTTFEFAAHALAAANDAIGGGGRYNGLVEQLGGPSTPGIGFGIGVERVLLACDAEEVFPAVPPGPDAFVVDLGDGGDARDLVLELRRAGLSADRAYDGRSLRAQLRHADRLGAAVAVIVGAEERAAGVVTLRDLRSDRSQRQVPRSEVVEALRRARATAGLGPSHSDQEVR
jgi:histidyl-tRNA synthetase